MLFFSMFRGDWLSCCVYENPRVGGKICLIACVRVLVLFVGFVFGVVVVGLCL